MGARTARLSVLAALCVLSASCAEEGPTIPVRGSFVVSRLAVDPATPLGQLFLREPASDLDRRVVDGIEELFDLSACWAGQSFAVAVDAERTGVRGAGMARMLLVTPAGERDLCGAGRAAVVQPSSFQANGEAIVGGPLFLEGQTLEARMSLGRVGEIVFSEAEVLPTWWSFRAQFVPLAGGGVSITEAEVSSTWSARELLQPIPQAEGLRYIDELVRLRFLPDTDVDGDGLETLLDRDRDGRVDLCMDGPASPAPREIEGEDCMHDPRMADGYLLQLRFQLYPVFLME